LNFQLAEASPFVWLLMDWGSNGSAGVEGGGAAIGHGVRVAVALPSDLSDQLLVRGVGDLEPGSDYDASI
jgi:hypothetical protein